jgi:FkbM family methyltransferase
VSYSKKFIRSLINAAGFDLHRLTPASNPCYRLCRALSRFEVDLVLDVGANIGQFSSELRSVGYKGRIVSFEPLSSAHKKLSDLASHDTKWQVYPRCALGEENVEAEINISANSFSSSMLPILPAHVRASRDSAYIGKERVQLVTLDSINKDVLGDSKVPFLKIDVQGFEWEVLNGALKTLTMIRGINCELSIVPLYEGQRLWLEVIRRLEREGYALWTMQEGFADLRDGRTLQLDATFFRS